ncbi:alpha/beta hydrolase [Streptomyces sp. NPDC058676]|uniref:alpha/beta hydrolase n=1 Tax=unclassified Streptomyces TaxID=2593676 RepID=UPI00364830E3
MDREDIEFTGELGTTLRGWFYPAQNAAGPAPVIVMAHGISGVKEMGLGEYAEVFAAGGLNVVVYDHQNFGASDGTHARSSTPSCSIATTRTRSPTLSLGPRSTRIG